MEREISSLSGRKIRRARIEAGLLTLELEGDDVVFIIRDVQHGLDLGLYPVMVVMVNEKEVARDWRVSD